MQIVDDLKRSFRESNLIMRLIYINIAVFVMQLLLGLFNLGAISNFFTMPSDPIGFVSRPWALVTYQFMHADPMHILFNMMWLYWFGELFLRFFNERQLISVYLLGGFAGAFLYFALFNIIPSFRMIDAILMGASASVTAIGVAVATYQPNLPINLFLFGQVRIKYLIWVMIIFDLWHIQAGNNVGGNYSHLGGAIFGFFFGQGMIKGNELGKGFSFFIDRLLKTKGLRRRRGPVLRQPVNEREMDFNANARKRTNQAEIDRILEKISKHGYDSLTKEEKQTLFRAGDN